MRLTPTAWSALIATTREWVEEAPVFDYWKRCTERFYGLNEEWEFPIEDDLLPHLELGGVRRLPFRPRSLERVAPDAVEALSELVGVQRGADLVVIPSATRPTAAGPVYVPLQVLGIGVRGVALWVQDLPHERIVAALPYSEIAMVEHAIAGDYGRLSVLGAHQRLSLWYRVEAWPVMRELLPRIRAATVGLPAPTAGTDGAALSVTWDALLSSPLVALAGARPEISVSIEAQAAQGWRSHRRVWPAAKAVLTSHELLVLADATQRGPLPQGVGMLAVPRTRIAAIVAKDARLTVATSAMAHGIDVGPRLVEAVRHEIAPHLPHSATSDR
jgi:hypothetical protein